MAVPIFLNDSAIKAITAPPPLSLIAVRTLPPGFLKKSFILNGKAFTGPNLMTLPLIKDTFFAASPSKYRFSGVYFSVKIIFRNKYSSQKIK